MLSLFIEDRQNVDSSPFGKTIRMRSGHFQFSASISPVSPSGAAFDAKGFAKAAKEISGATGGLVSVQD
ncbi:MAG: hypothetical protein M5U07_23220 [Xanthobacteraceae bacterium]|nr:hypothetical protein [Xanthobacteraceae bacterium]